MSVHEQTHIGTRGCLAPLWTSGCAFDLTLYETERDAVLAGEDHPAGLCKEAVLAMDRVEIASYQTSFYDEEVRATWGFDTAEFERVSADLGGRRPDICRHGLKPEPIHLTD